jgi:hypothetical protein
VLNVKSWREKANNRYKWESVVKEAKVLEDGIAKEYVR